MSQVKEQKQHIEDIAVARYISGTLRDISAIELGGLMQKFGTNNMFYNELIELYQIVWRLAQQREDQEKKREPRSLYVAYTTNRHFYGALNRNIMHLFKNKTGTQDHCLVIGDTGRNAWMAHRKKREVLNYLSFKNDMPTEEETRSFIKHVAPYDRVFVFYPRFVSVFSQQAAMVDISFRPPEPAEETRSKDEDIQFLLEPDIDEMITFFSMQVRAALFERILLETELSRVSARLVKMDSAEQNADGLLVEEGRTLRRMYTSLASRQMLETLVGYIQWHKKNVQHIVQ